MRKIIVSVSLIVFLIIGFLTYSQSVFAQACVNWGQPICIQKFSDGSCFLYDTPCDDNPSSGYCFTGQYSCNRPSGCCDIGQVGGGNNNYVCDWTKINCLPGYAKDTTGGYSDYCGLITGCPGAGTSQDNIPPGCGGTFCADEKCTINKNGVEKCKCLEWRYRRQTIRTYGCVPTAPVCTPASPTAPTLSSPANGASLVDIAVDLIWNSTNFGTACTAPYSQYQIYLDQNNPPTTLIGTVAGGGKV